MLKQDRLNLGWAGHSAAHSSQMFEVRSPRRQQRVVGDARVRRDVHGGASAAEHSLVNVFHDLVHPMTIQH